MKSKLKWIFSLLLALSMQFAFAQEKTVTGVVSDATGPIPGANVLVKGTKRSVQTDLDGKYAVKATVGDVLLFSYIGTKGAESKVGARNVINVTMDSSANILEEIVVVAYGTSTKEALTGSVSKISAASIEKRPLVNLSSAIEGAGPGVLVTAPSGQPGAGQTIRIRGFGSFSNSNDALYVVDGIPISGDLSSINTSDIESISILKDAGSTALFGNKASNGVVLVTTKKGKKEGGSLKVSMSTGVVSRGTREYDRLNPSDYYEAFWEARRNAAAVPGIATPAALAAASLSATNNIVGTNLLYNPFNVPNNQVVGVDGKINPAAQLLYPDDLDWEKAISRLGIRRNMDMSFDNRSAKGGFYASIGYFDEEGYILNTDFNRVTARVNADVQAKPWIKLGMNISGNVSKGNQGQTGGSNSFVNPFRFTRGIGSIYPVYAHDPTTGEYILDSNGERILDLDAIRPSGASNGRHIVGEILKNRDLDERNNLSAKSLVELKLAKGLTFTNNMSYEVENIYTSFYQNAIVGDGAPSGSATKTYARQSTIAFNQLLNYSIKVNENHNFEVLAGHETQNYTFDNLTGRKLLEIFKGNEELDNFVTITNLSSRVDKQKEESYFGRFNYNYDNKYFLSSSVRRDGTSVFAPDLRWGNFWSLGLSWSIDKEDFISKISWIDNLKLRGSTGELGNARLLTAGGSRQYYGYQALLGLGYNNQGAAGVVLSSPGSPNLLWEKSFHTDVALEFGFFNRLSGSVEYYKKVSKDLIFAVPLPLSAGGTIYGNSALQNVGELFNRGFEVSLTYDIIKKRDFNWSMTFNASTIENKITQLPQEEIINGTKKLKVGQSLFDYWIRDWYGVDPTDGSGLFVAADPLAAGVRTVDGLAVTPFSNNAKFDYLGSVLPDLYGSINSSFKYKNFGLDFLFTYQIGGQNLDFNYAGLLDTGNFGGALHQDINNRWRSPGDITDIPRADATLANQWQVTSDRFLVDASYVSLRQINLTYDLPQSIVEKIGASNMRFFANAENVFNINARRGFSQQQDFSGNTSNVFIPSRIVTFGLNVNF